MPLPWTAVKQPRPSETRVSGAGGQRPLRELLDGLFGEGALGQAHEHGLAGFGGLHGGDELDLVVRAAAGLPAGTLAPEME